MKSKSTPRNDGANRWKAPNRADRQGAKGHHPENPERSRMARSSEGELRGSREKQRNQGDRHNRNGGQRMHDRAGLHRHRIILFESESPPGFRLSLKVKVGNAWLEKLGGGPCMIGSDEHPVKQHLVTSGAGSAGDWCRIRRRIHQPRTDQQRGWSTSAGTSRRIRARAAAVAANTKRMSTTRSTWRSKSKVGRRRNHSRKQASRC